MKIKITLASSFVVIAGLMGGCSTGEIKADCNDLVASESIANVDEQFAVVIAPTDNFISFENAFSQSSQRLRDLLKASDTTKQLSIVVADGSPRVLATAWVDFAGTAVGSQRDSIVDEALYAIQDAAECVSRTDGSGIPVTDQSDMIGAIQKAGDTFTQSSTDSAIFVFGNGLQTAGALKMQDAFPQNSKEAESLIRQLRESNPPVLSSEHLHGARVFWSGLGQVSSQEPNKLNAESQDVLAQLWQGILAADGANLDDGGVSPGTVPESAGSQSGGIVVDDVVALGDTCTFLLKISDDEIGFVDNSSKFLNDSAALDVAHSVARQISKTGCSTPITVTGYVASGVSRAEFEKNPNAGVSLSDQRAQAFKKLLERAGVTVSISAVGKGKGPVFDWDDQGNKVEALQKQNRIVVVSQ